MRIQKNFQLYFLPANYTGDKRKPKPLKSPFPGRHDIHAFNLLLTSGHFIKLLPSLLQIGCNLSRAMHMEDLHPGH